LDEADLDKNAPATWLNGLSKVGKAAAEGWGKYTGAAGSLVSVIGAELEVKVEDVQMKETWLVRREGLE
jgi:hypothetical protein